MPRPHSAGILLFRQRESAVQVLLIKPGGPFWKNKDAGAWMIPKGMIEPGEAPAEAALREFEEETGTRLNAVPFPLATVRQAGGKRVEAFALEGDLDPAAIRSNDFEME
ncbi:MAG TPA: NUDIX domain-containing protein, partial [Sphingomicrobium sp.]|nr:NUDIX domain-containing protein [Sphingomicrobium sp.]